MASQRQDHRRIPSDDDWMQLWQTAEGGVPNVERQTSLLLTLISHFDRGLPAQHPGVRRRLRADGHFAGQTLLGVGVRTGAIGLFSVGFVLAYLWWNHRQMT